MKRFLKRSAFTIVEMVIVIAVIGILATVMIPTISGMIERANKSADTQFAASLTIQLAVESVDGGIRNESDLRNAVNKYYGKWNEDKTVLEEDYYNTKLVPKAAKSGNYFWYHYDSGTVFAATVEDAPTEAAKLLSSPSMDASGGSTSRSFSSASLRSDLIPGLYLMGCKPATGTGGELVDIISQFENLGDAKYFGGEVLDADLHYVTAVNDLMTAAEGNALMSELLAKVQKTTIVNEFGAFRHEGASAVWIPAKEMILAQTEVYCYVGGDVEKVENKLVVGTLDTNIELPSCVKVALGGLPAINPDRYTNEDLIRDYANVTHLYVNVENVSDLANIYTDCVLVMPDGSRYVYLGEEYFKLPLTINSATGKPSDSSVGSVNTETAGSIDKIGITCPEAATSTRGQDKVYLHNNALHIAYDKGTVQLNLADGVTNSMVNWTTSDASVATVVDGAVTVKLPDITGAEKIYTAVITATSKQNPDVKDTVTICVVRPNSALISVGTSSNIDLYNDTDKGSIKIDYTGNNAEHAIKLNTVIDNYGGQSVFVDGVVTENTGFVSLATGTLAYTTEGNLFTIDNNMLKLPSSVVEGEQELTISYTDANGVVLFEKTFVVAVEDNSAVGLKKNQITSTVQMGEKYLFRVGNIGNFMLGKLFSPAEANKAVKVEAVNIYDAAGTTYTSEGEAEYKHINSESAGGFWGECTINSAEWDKSTIKFGGTGVAIIKVITSAGNVELAVEVLNAKNVTSASDFSGATNYVVLNDIAWGSSKDVEISGTIYGNGFAINATTYQPTVSGNTAMFALSGTIDNLVINGPIYPEVSYSGEQYYVAGIYTTGNAKITNSYISGFRSPITANGSSLYLENTTLKGGNYANLWLQTGTLTLKDVTTVQAPTKVTVGGNNEAMGMGIVVNSGVSASDVTIKGAFNQYNWANESDANSMDSDVKSLVSTIFNNNDLTHNVNGTKYINTGILFLGQNGTVVNAEQTNNSNYESLTVSGKFMGVNVSAKVYTYASTNGSISTVPSYSSYAPNKQMTLEPSFKYSPVLGTKPADVANASNYNYMENGVIYIGMDTSKETFTLDLSKYTVSKYIGQDIAVSIACNGGSMNDKKVTFSTKGTYTVTFTVTDNTFFTADGKRVTENKIYVHKVTVVVANTVIPSAKIDVSGIDKTIYMGLEGKTSDTDYAAFFAALKGLKITDYDENGDPYSVTISLDTIPTGLTISYSNSEFTKKYTKDGVLYIGDTKANNNNDYSSITATYKYVGNNKTTVSATVTYTGFSTYTQLYDDRTSGGGCVTPETLVMLADGTQKMIKDVTYADKLLVWNFNTGKYDVMPASIVMNHGYGNYTVTTLTFSDGTTVNTINGHGFFDIAEKKYVIINDANAADYIGHEFVKVAGDGYTTVTLEDFSISERYTESWSILTANQYNCILENMWTLTPAEVEGSPDYLMPFEIGADLKYDEAKMQADIEMYGLYTYEDFAEYCTYEQFIGFGFDHFKVSVEKGYITWDGIEFLLNLHLGGNK